MARFNVIVFLVGAILPTKIHAYDTTTCCDLARSEGAFLSPVPSLGNQTCGQTYSTSLNAALPLYVNYTYCSSKCSGMGLSKGSQPSEWAAPLVNFILPSVIFSMTIPRRKKIEFDYLFDWRRRLTKRKKWLWVNTFVQLALSMICFSIILVPVFIDTIVWISVIIVGAGNMLIGGLYEAHLDYRIVKYVEDIGRSRSAPAPDDKELTITRGLLVTIAAGNLKLDKGSPEDTIPKSITIPGVGDPSEGAEKSRSRLLNLLGAQMSFGSAVGSPVLFYLGAFVYTILDLRNNPSSQDSAISLGFGIDDAYDTTFQPVSLWSRGSNKLLWIKRSQAWKSEDFREVMKITSVGWIVKVLFPALVLIVLPPATGGVVAYFTPPRGLGCRSLSFIVYAFSQVMVTVIATIRCAVDSGEKDNKKKTNVQKIFTGRGFKIISAPFWFGSLVAAIGGTTMQITGVFRNCICYTDARTWWNINNIDPTVNLASDTQDARNSSVYWIKMGSTATVFMAVNCYIGWWYQRLIRHRFTDAVKKMYTPEVLEALPEAQNLNGNKKTGESGEKEDDSRSSGNSKSGEDDLTEGNASATKGLLSEQDQTSIWAQQTTEAITEHLGADRSDLRRISASRHTSVEPEATRPWAGPLTSTSSDGSTGDEVEVLLCSTTNGARADS
ncbi:hypothetical protein L207DRAFT_477734 [Hyaloscypha variabilis F]|uniref:Uncharacterized protein n=1 Tax=Hyaloscypha variabilis (strain UAMH 11265 / GT02V1 / F) TaxID=1149755 RepID=A0A2J6SE28_HYAVF|nr:hypothetical protein L207DRAFT_477734 [Hyaloscypha variabilis F]